MAKLLTLKFSPVFLKLCFFYLIPPAERRKILKTQKQQKHEIKVAKLLTYGGQVINPTALTKKHIYIYILWIYIYCGVIRVAKFGLLRGY